MISLGGVALVFIMVFGGYILAGGRLGVILHSLPFEMMMIGGSALGALIVSNSIGNLKKTLGGFAKVVSGPKWKRTDYTDLLCLLFVITKTMKAKGMMALETHVDNPKDSSIFGKYPRIMKDHFALDLICDTLRMMSMNVDDPHQVEEAIEKQLHKHHHETEAAAEAIQSMADGLPALGIVAAVLGVIKTMAAISEPPEVLGHMIGGALTGTFLGVFLAYGIVGPFAARLKSIFTEEARFYDIIRDTLVAHLHGYAAQISIEIGRGSVPSALQPSFSELETMMSSLPAAEAA